MKKGWFMTLLYQHQFVFINTKIGRSKDPTWFHPDVKIFGALTNVRRVTRSKNHFGFPWFLRDGLQLKKEQMMIDHGQHG